MRIIVLTNTYTRGINTNRIYYASAYLCKVQGCMHRHSCSKVKYDIGSRLICGLDTLVVEDLCE